jgi:hypothetical protein
MLSWVTDKKDRLLRYGTLNSERVPLKGVLLLLLSVDAAFIVVFIVSRVLYPGEESNFGLEHESGYPAMFQYGEQALIVLLMAIAAVRNRSLLYLCWSLLFLYLLLDDFLMIHETLGVLVSQELSFSRWLGLRRRDFGELVVWLFFGSVLLPPIAILHILCRGSTSAQWSRYLLITLGALVLTGGVFDMLGVIVGAIVRDYPLLSALSIVADDGGEMVVWSVTLWIVLLIARENLNSWINCR